MNFNYEEYNEKLIRNFDDHNISLRDFCLINKNLINFTKYNISIEIPPNTVGLGIDIKDHIVPMIRNEMNQNIHKIILSKISSTKNVDFIDLRQYENKSNFKLQQNTNRIDEIVSKIYQHKYSNLVTSGMMAAEHIQDSKMFIVDALSQTNTMGLVYKIGKIGDTKVWVDPYMKYTDDKIVLFDNVEVNIEIRNISATPNLNPLNSMSITKLILDYDLDFNIGNSLIILLIDGISSSGYKKFIPTLRNTKIDEIIN